MRNRLLASVVLCAVAVLAAGAPTVAAASRDATDAQELVDLAGLNRQAIALSHSLADERDGMVEYIAAGRTSRGGAGVSESQRARVDRQIREIRAASPPSYVTKALKRMPKTRQRAITGRGNALDAYTAYTRVIEDLRGVTQSVVRDLPARAQDATAGALPDLARAIDQASATRGLLRGAMAGKGAQRELTTQAQQARVRERSALADFDEMAGAKARDSYSTTVNGTDVNVAERYLDKLTSRPYLTTSARTVDRGRLDAAVSARIAHMRGVQSSFAVAEIKRLEGLRDDDVTALQIRAALLGVCLLLAVGISVTTARSLARPLSVLKRGSQRLAEDPGQAEPITFNGRNDEFADVVRALNALRATAADLRRRAACAESEQDELAVSKAELTERHTLLQDDFLALRDELEAAREEMTATAGATHGTFVHLALRSLGLVERQLAVLEGLEEKETDPDQLATLFKLDHLATRMRRHGENLLLLAGSEQSGGHQQSPAPLLDVLRAAVSEIERYERVELGSLPPHIQVSGFAADDLSHLVAELLDNAASFSPPESEVRLSGWMLENGEVMLSVQDDGIGVSDNQLIALNTRLGEPEALHPPFAADGSTPVHDEATDGLGMGLYVVARLAARHGLRVQLRKQKQGGTAAVVIVPRKLLPDRPAPAASAPAGATGRADGTELPGSVAEANSNALPVRRKSRVTEPEEVTGTEAALGTEGTSEAEDTSEAQVAFGAEKGSGAADVAGALGIAEAAEAAEAAGVAGVAGVAEAGEEGIEPSEAVGARGGVDGGDGADSGETTVSVEVPQLDAASETAACDADDSEEGDDSAESEVPESEVPGAGAPRTGRATEPEAAEPDQGDEPADEHGRADDQAPAHSSDAGGVEVTQRSQDTRDTRDAQATQDDQATHGTGSTTGPGATDAIGATGAVGAISPAKATDGARDAQGSERGSVDAEVTVKGLPKRTPRIAARETAPPRARKGGANADELRRRLGGFQQGAREGLRDAEAQVAAEEGVEEQAGAQVDGGTAEEARK
ncbi:nitrate- and nitrite sensing domain-containing protein [Streptomyces iconiensis]|uniref:histidine kinase n=1 Tax=Streptomyces iconiensis TaxID=1384038 RepID=A0ABT7A2E0_9ACTN|nr:sensor histidine kinase [Streptomyces iconiensis]MDJ1135234.1 nitrate- and nitrite sensing domain-containing protein [Streptomyces iconiensis]